MKQSFKNFIFRFSPFLSFTISGKSMLPNFLPGEKILVKKKWFFCKLNTGDAVVLKDPRNGRIILKRIKKINPPLSSLPSERNEGRVHFCREYFLLGDNLKESSDSQVFGWIKEADIIGKAI